MRRRNRWLVARLNLTSITGIAFAAMMIYPGLNIISADQQVEQKLLMESFSADQLTGLALGSQDVLIQNNITVTTINEDAPRTDVMVYVVQSGDTLYDIGERFNVTMESLAYINDISNEHYISPGDEIKIPPVTGVLHAVKSGETISTIAEKWNVPPQAIVDINYLDEPYTLAVGQELVIPKEEVPQPVSSIPSTLAYAGTSQGLQLDPVGGSASGTLSMPAAGRLTQYFSWYHTAIDVAASCGTPITAADSGTITFAGWWPGGGGNSIFIDHGNGYVTKYAHLNAFSRSGGYVNKGEVIGYMGATGRAYGCHVHFMVLSSGRAINPLSVIR